MALVYYHNCNLPAQMLLLRQGVGSDALVVLETVIAQPTTQFRSYILFLN